MRYFAITAVAVAAIGSVLAGEEALDPQNQWPQWRGPLGNGVAPPGDPPVEWSEQQNIRWKFAIPGKGHSTPVIWGERIFLMTAAPYGDELPPRFSVRPDAHDIEPVTKRHQFMVIAVNRRDGRILWKRTVREALPRAGAHITASLASNSPVTDGEHLFAFFGSNGLYCLDLNGKPIWEADFGDLRTLHSHGEGSSPVLHGETLIVVWDHEGESFLVALDKRTGTERWRVKREVRSTSWTTPIVVEEGGQEQVVVSGSEHVRGYDLATGKEIWKCAGLSVENLVSSPVSGGGMVFTGSTYDRSSMLAIRLEGAQGDISDSENVLWNRRRGAPYVPSPLLYDERLYFLAHMQGFLTCVRARTGEPFYGPERLPGTGHVFASPVGAAKRVYIARRDGSTVVIRHGPRFEILAHNRLEDSFSASPAVVGNELYLRGEQSLYCIAEKRPE